MGSSMTSRGRRSTACATTCSAEVKCRYRRATDLRSVSARGTLTASGIATFSLLK